MLSTCKKNTKTLCKVLTTITCSHSSPARGCAGPGNHPERLATRRAVPGLHTMSLLEEDEIWASGSRPDSRPCRSEHGASGAESGESRSFSAGRTYVCAVTHIPTWELLSFTTGLHCWLESIKSLDWNKQEREGSSTTASCPICN